MTAAATAMPYTPSVPREFRTYLEPIAGFNQLSLTSIDLGDRREGHAQEIDLTSTPIGRIEITSTGAEALLGVAVAGIVLGWLVAALGSRPGARQLAAGTLAGIASGALSQQLAERRRLARAALATVQQEMPGAPVAARGRAPVRAAFEAVLAPEEVCVLRDAIQAASGLSRQQIAQVIGVDRRSLSAWASGETVPSSHHLGRLRVLHELVSRMRALGLPQLSVCMRDAPTAGAVTVALREEDVDRALGAVLTPQDDDADDRPAGDRPPQLTRRQWAALVRLAAAAATSESSPSIVDQSPEAELDLEEGEMPRYEIHRDLALRATPRHRLLRRRGG